MRGPETPVGKRINWSACTCLTPSAAIECTIAQGLIAVTIVASKRQKAFKIGDRVCYSDRGRERFKFHADRIGTVIGYTHSAGALNVCFDGNKAHVPVHMDYLQRVTSEA